MAIYRTMDWVLNTRIQVAGYSSCPVCNHVNLIHPTSVLKVNPFTGKPFHLVTPGLPNDGLFNPYSTSDFPSYESWFCVDNGHIFRQPAFLPASEYQGFTPETPGDPAREF